jgi:hypothetical protein
MESFGSFAKGLVTGKMVEDMLGTIKRGARGRCWCRSNTRPVSLTHHSRRAMFECEFQKHPSDLPASRSIKLLFFVEQSFGFQSLVERVYSGAEAMILGHGLNLNNTISLFTTVDVRPGASPRLQCSDIQVPPLLPQRVDMIYKHLSHIFQRLPQFRK